MTKSCPDIGKAAPLTETRNPRTVYLDRMPTRELVGAFVREDRQIITAMEAITESLVQTIDLVVATLTHGGRLFYLGAGTSGRLGILDAAECPPTFGVAPDVVQAVMAGGPDAVSNAAEGAEDRTEDAVLDLQERKLQAHDMVLGITASGTTPYVLAGLQYASRLGCKTGLLTCNPYGERPPVDVLINPVVGPEVIAGSTRLKSATVCKMALNIISSAAMVRMGKVYENLMVDLRASNDKLRRRALQIVMEGAGVPNYLAEVALNEADGEVKTAIYLAKRGGTKKEAQQAIAAANGILYIALEEESYA